MEPPLPTLTKAERAQVAATWLDRARSEEVATLRFERLARELEQLGTHPTVLEYSKSAIEEERAHAILCHQVAQEYGADHIHHADPHQAAPLAPKAVGPEDALLFELVAFCCLTESLNAALLLEITQQAKAGDIRQAAQTILKDEVQHSRMGWAHLNWARSHGLGDFLEAALPYMLNQTGAEELSLTSGHLLESPALVAHGELPYAKRKELFDQVIHQIFFPGLEHMNIDTAQGRAWMKQNFQV